MAKFIAKGVAEGAYFSMQNTVMLQKIFRHWKSLKTSKHNSKSIIILSTDYEFLKKKAESRNNALKLDDLKDDKFILKSASGVKLGVPIYARKHSKDFILSNLGFEVHNPEHNFSIFFKNRNEAASKQYLDQSNNYKSCIENEESLSQYINILRRSRDIKSLCSKLTLIVSES